MTAVAHSTAAPPASDKLPAELVRLALTIMFGAIMVALDMTMVNVALDTLQRDFHTSVATIQWISTGYLLALAMVIPLAGWAIERYGAKPLWMVALGLFITGSVLSGVAWSAGSLIAFRVVQGLGGGLIMPLAQTILARAAGPDRLGRVMAVVGVPAMLGPVVGPVLGGLIVSDASWRLMFYINVPICIAALLATRRVAMPATKRPEASRLDAIGLSLLSPALVALVYGLSQAGSHGSFTDAPAIAWMLGGAVLLTAFAVHALRTRTEPIIDVRLFRQRSFAGFSAVVFFFSMAMLGTALLLPLYYQQVRGENALHAGLLLAPQGLGMAIALVVASRLTDRLSPRPIIAAGLGLTASAMLTYTQIDAHTSFALLSAAAFVSGLGIGAALVPAMAGVYKHLPTHAVATATSAIRIFQQLGGSFGIAILAVVLQQHAAGAITTAGLAAAFADTFWWALAITGIAVLPTLLLPGGRSDTARRVTPPAPRPAHGT
jgi:EmrB/QacA subfamily drug resistance transporter